MLPLRHTHLRHSNERNPFARQAVARDHDFGLRNPLWPAREHSRERNAYSDEHLARGQVRVRVIWAHDRRCAQRQVTHWHAALRASSGARTQLRPRPAAALHDSDECARVFSLSFRSIRCRQKHSHTQTKGARDTNTGQQSAEQATGGDAAALESIIAHFARARTHTHSSRFCRTRTKVNGSQRRRAAPTMTINFALLLCKSVEENTTALEGLPRLETK